MLLTYSKEKIIREHLFNTYKDILLETDHVLHYIFVLPSKCLNIYGLLCKEHYYFGIPRGVYNCLVNIFFVNFCCSFLNIITRVFSQ